MKTTNNNNTTLKLVKLSVIRSLFENDTKQRKANKSANQVIINLLDLVNDDSAQITLCRASNDSAMPSRGITAECLVKLWLNNQKSAKWQSNDKRADTYHNGKAYEIKCSTSKGYAHYNPNQNLDNLIFVNQYGIFQTTGANIILDKCGKHIKDIKMNANVKTLVEW